MRLYGLKSPLFFDNWIIQSSNTFFPSRSRRLAVMNVTASTIQTVCRVRTFYILAIRPSITIGLQPIRPRLTKSIMILPPWTRHWIGWLDENRAGVKFPWYWLAISSLMIVWVIGLLLSVGGFNIKIFVIKNPLTLKLHIKSMEPHLLYNRYSKRNLSKH